LVRFATQEYEKANKNNRNDVFMHLTNFAVNKLNPKFTRSLEEEEDRSSHKRSILNFFQELREQGYEIDACWEKVKHLIVKTLCSIQPILKSNYTSIQPDDPYNQGCFEILGFDVLLDKDLNPYLLEVNHAPSLKVDSQVDLKVKGNLIYDVLNMMGISANTKKRLKKMKKDHTLQRTLTGRRVKLSEGEFKDRCIEERDKVLMKFKGGFEKIYPSNDESLNHKYREFMERADKRYRIYTGADVIKSNKKPLISSINLLDHRRRFNTLESIYGIKEKRKKKKIPKTKISLKKIAEKKEKNQSGEEEEKELLAQEKKQEKQVEAENQVLEEEERLKKEQQLKEFEKKREEIANLQKLKFSGLNMDDVKEMYWDIPKPKKSKSNMPQLQDGANSLLKNRTKHKSGKMTTKSEEKEAPSGHLIRYPAVDFKGMKKKKRNNTEQINFTGKIQKGTEAIVKSSKLGKLKPLPNGSIMRLQSSKKHLNGQKSQIGGINVHSSGSLSRNTKKKANYKAKKSLTSYNRKVKKYLMSPYVDVDPFLTFNKNYREKMKALALKLHTKTNTKGRVR
jgi:hypothetical protein